MEDSTESQVNDLLDSLDDIGYLPDANATTEDYVKAIQAGPSSDKFRSLVAKLMTELGAQEGKQVTIDARNAAAFSRDVEAALGPIGFPFEWRGAPLWSSTEAKLSLLDFLRGEVQAARMIAARTRGAAMEAEPTVTQPAHGPGVSATVPPRTLELSREVASVLQLAPTADAAKNLAAATERLRKLIPTLPAGYVGKPLIAHGALSPKDMEFLQEISDALKKEYEDRKGVMLKRVDVTLQSFMWGGRGEERKAELQAVVNTVRREINSATSVALYDIFACHDDLAQIVKTSDKRLQQGTKTSLKNMVIGKVPDRGGRVLESRAGMPGFSARSDLPQREGGGRGGRGGGRVQGGWSGGGGGQQQQQHQQHQQPQQQQQQQGGGRGGGGWSGGKRARGGWSK